MDPLNCWSETSDHNRLVFFGGILVSRLNLIGFKLETDELKSRRRLPFVLI